MSDRKITDRDYLFLSSMLKARESRMLTRDRLEQMLSGTAAEAAKVLSESGWPDMAGMNPEEIDKALSARRVEMTGETMHSSTDGSGNVSAYAAKSTSATAR